MTLLLDRPLAHLRGLDFALHLDSLAVATFFGYVEVWRRYSRPARPTLHCVSTIRESVVDTGKLTGAIWVPGEDADEE